VGIEDFDAEFEKFKKIAEKHKNDESTSF